MSAILKALKKLEQDPDREAALGVLWQRETEPQKPLAKRMRRLYPRTVVLCALLVSVLALGGWLLVKDTPLLTEKSQPVRPVQESMARTAANTSAGAGPVPKKADLKPKANSPRIPRTASRKQKVPDGKTVVPSRTGVRVPERKGGKPPPARVDSGFFQTPSGPMSASGPPSQRDVPALKQDDTTYPPSGSSYPLRTADKPAVDESSVLTGFSVQAIAWSKIPAERIAVINGKVLREGGAVGGVQVIQIGLDEVYLKKDEKVWLLKCGR